MNLKKLLEQKNSLCDKVNELCLTAEKEERALTPRKLKKLTVNLLKSVLLKNQLKLRKNASRLSWAKVIRVRKNSLPTKKNFH